MKKVLFFLIVSMPLVMGQSNVDKPIDLLTPRIPPKKEPSSNVDSPVGDPVAVDPKAVRGIIISATAGSLLIQTETPIVVKDGSNRTVKVGDVIFLIFEQAAPKFPTDTRISTKIDPRGTLKDYVTAAGSGRTVYAFRVVQSVREIRD